MEIELRLVPDDNYTEKEIKFIEQLLASSVKLAKNNSDKLFKIAEFYRFDREQRLEFEALAFELYWIASEKGHFPSLRAVCEMYRKGIGCDEDLYKAFECASYLAHRGDSWGQRQLAAHYIRGDGTPRQPEIANYWWRRAAFKGDPRSAFQLAESYRLGEGVVKSKKLAASWYREALARGIDAAQEQLIKLRKEE